jgi:hypothetical protein
VFEVTALCAIPLVAVMDFRLIGHEGQWYLLYVHIKSIGRWPLSSGWVDTKQYSESNNFSTVGPVWCDCTLREIGAILFFLTREAIKNAILWRKQEFGLCYWLRLIKTFSYQKWGSSYLSINFRFPWSG